MGRILAIDYGSKRVGIAVTDPLQMIATALTTVHSKDIITFLEAYLKKEDVESFVVGEPKRLNNTRTHSSDMVDNFVKLLKNKFPGIPVYSVDERFTSKLATQAILMSGLKKKDRQNKELVDSTSATIILQSFMESRR